MGKSLPTMIEIGDKVVSLDIVSKKFYCDVQKCKGACCVIGASGAPLEDDEADILKSEYNAIKPYLRPEGIHAIEAQGTSVMDADREMVTPLVAGRECAYAVFENGIARCGIENAFEDGATVFRKPVSCHIYPVRVKRYRQFMAVNYDQWTVCDPARKRGEEKGKAVFEFVREGMIRKFGADFYEKLGLLSDQIHQEE